MGCEEGFDIPVGCRNEDFSVVGEEVLTGELLIQQYLGILTDHHSTRLTIRLHFIGDEHVNAKDVVPHNIGANHSAQELALQILEH